MSGENIGLLARTGHSLLGAVGALMRRWRPGSNRPPPALPVSLYVDRCRNPDFNQPLLRDFWPFSPPLPLGA